MTSMLLSEMRPLLSANDAPSPSHDSGKIRALALQAGLLPAWESTESHAIIEASPTQAETPPTFVKGITPAKRASLSRPAETTTAREGVCFCGQPILARSTPRGGSEEGSNSRHSQPRRLQTRRQSHHGQTTSSSISSDVSFVSAGSGSGHGAALSSDDEDYCRDNDSDSASSSAPPTPTSVVLPLPLMVIATDKMHQNQQIAPIKNLHQLHIRNGGNNRNLEEQDEEEEFVEALEERLATVESDSEDDEEDERIYCSSACARRDALMALLARQRPELVAEHGKRPDAAAMEKLMSKEQHTALINEMKLSEQEQNSTSAAAAASIAALVRKDVAAQMMCKLNQRNQLGQSAPMTEEEAARMERIVKRASATLQMRYPDLVISDELQRLLLSPTDDVGGLFESDSPASPTSPRLVKPIPLKANRRRQTVLIGSGSHYRRMEALSTSTFHEMMEPILGINNRTTEDEKASIDAAVNKPIPASSNAIHHVPMASTSSNGSSGTQDSVASAETAATSITSGSRPASSSYRPSRESVVEKQLDLERQAKLQQELKSLDRELKKTFDAFEYDHSFDLLEESEDEAESSYISPLGWGQADDLFSHEPVRLDGGDWKDTNSPNPAGAGGKRRLSGSGSASGNALALQLGSPSARARQSILSFKYPAPSSLVSPPPTLVELQGHEQPASLASSQDSLPIDGAGRDTAVPAYPTSPAAAAALRTRPLQLLASPQAPASAPKEDDYLTPFISPTSCSSSHLSTSRNAAKLRKLSALGKRPQPATSSVQQQESEDLYAQRLTNRLDTILKARWNQIRGIAK